MPSLAPRSRQCAGPMKPRARPHIAVPPAQEPMIGKPSPNTGETKPATSEQRRGLGRLQTLVVATADAADMVLGDIDQIIDAATAGPEGGAGTVPWAAAGTVKSPTRARALRSTTMPSPRSSRTAPPSPAPVPGSSSTTGLHRCAPESAVERQLPRAPVSLRECRGVSIFCATMCSGISRHPRGHRHYPRRYGGVLLDTQAFPA